MRSLRDGLVAERGVASLVGSAERAGAARIEKQGDVSKNPDDTAAIRRHYDRKARFYDLMEWGPERVYRRWRRRLWREVRGERVLEIGVGTGLNIPFYPAAAQITAIDFSEQMLERARRAAGDASVDLRLGDVEQLDFPEGTFDAAVATCVFSSVPDALSGLREVRRVLRPGAALHLIDHGRSDRALVGRAQDWVDAAAVRWTGVHVNRRLAATLAEAGFAIDEARFLEPAHIFTLIRAHRAAE